MSPKRNPDRLDHFVEGVTKGCDSEQQLKILNPIDVDPHIGSSNQSTNVCLEWRLVSLQNNVDVHHMNCCLILSLACLRKSRTLGIALARRMCYFANIGRYFMSLWWQNAIYQEESMWYDILGAAKTTCTGWLFHSFFLHYASQNNSADTVSAAALFDAFFGLWWRPNWPSASCIG